MDWQMAVMWGLLACGLFFSTLRGLIAGFRLIAGRRRKLEEASVPSTPGAVPTATDSKS
jgi:hypothetical protein